METTIVTPEEVKKRLTDLDRRRRDAAARKREIDGKLDHERNRLYTDEANRKGNLELLAGADDDSMRGYLENEIDGLDESIRSHKRLIEALEGALAKVTVEIEQVNREWKALDDAVEAQELAERFQEWKADVERRYNTASDNLDAARTSLGELGIAVREGREEFGPQADRWLVQLNEAFFRKQGNLDGRGFQRRFDYNEQMFNFVIFPAVRKSS